MARTSYLLITCALAAMGCAQAQAFSVLHTFQYFPHGASPYAPLYRDSSGNLYGTTNGGGPYNAGVVFKLDSAGSLTVMHTFTGGADGGNPCAGLAADSAGDLYGTAYQGGAAGAGANKAGAGVVYKIDSSGQFSVLYTFTGGADGSGPSAAVIPDSSGNVYGTTYYGGSSGYGVVFKISPAGLESVLYSFKGSPDGAYPLAGVTADDSGNLYGTTYGGGSGPPLGVVYKLTASGQETVLFNFADGDTGNYPMTGVILDASGNIYGSAYTVIYESERSGQVYGAPPVCSGDCPDHRAGARCFRQFLRHVGWEPGRAVPQRRGVQVGPWRRDQLAVPIPGRDYAACRGWPPALTIP